MNSGTIIIPPGMRSMVRLMGSWIMSASAPRGAQEGAAGGSLQQGRAAGEGHPDSSFPSRRHGATLRNMTSQREKAAAFRQLHSGPRLLVLPNAWDVASVRIIETAG